MSIPPRRTFGKRNYNSTHTQQTSKSVITPTVSTVTQAMSYGLSGQLERVVTTTQNGSGVVTGRTRVDYRYNPQGIRTISIDWTDANLDGTFAAGERTGSVEYLIENANFTGYQQTILETVKNAAGQATKRTSYTFGVDEITQTVSQIDPSSQLITQSSTLTFAHDGKGSVRALFSAAAAIAQVFTYSAYGELLAIHNGAGTLQPLTSSLTSVLYNGEGFDTRTGLYNMRARWYSASNARWERLDPFNGNPHDPFSFNKYGFVHGDPVMGTDPTGMFFSVGGFFSASAISGAMRGMNQFAVYAGRQAAIAGIETGIEVVIGNLIAAATGVSFDNDPNEIARTFATNAASNIATAGIGNKTRHAILLRNMLDFAVRMVSDVAIGGENIMWAAAVNLMSFGASYSAIRATHLFDRAGGFCYPALAREEERECLDHCVLSCLIPTKWGSSIASNAA